MSETYGNTKVCKHGHLERVCLTCELERSLVEKDAEIERLKADNIEIKAINQRQGKGIDAYAAEVEGLKGEVASMRDQCNRMIECCHETEARNQKMRNCDNCAGTTCDGEQYKTTPNLDKCWKMKEGK